jgi:hypothetical protein
MLPGRHLPPQGARQAIWKGVLASMLEDPAVRLAETTSRPTGSFTGGGLIVQRFIRAPVTPNGPEAIETAPIYAGNNRRALSRGRGFGA